MAGNMNIQHHPTNPSMYAIANPVNFVFVWVPVTQDKVVKVQEPLPNCFIKTTARS